jgi:hypothetical protein
MVFTIQHQGTMKLQPASWSRTTDFFKEQLNKKNRVWRQEFCTARRYRSIMDDVVVMSKIATKKTKY